MFNLSMVPTVASGRIYTPCLRCRRRRSLSFTVTPRHRQSHKQDKVNKTKTEQDPKEQQHTPALQENNPLTSDAPPDVVVVLVEQGISDKVARKLASTYSQAQIEEKLAYLAFLQEERPESVLKPSGWLRKAIEEDYARRMGT
jgi:hypothetical protein